MAVQVECSAVDRKRGVGGEGIVHGNPQGAAVNNRPTRVGALAREQNGPGVAVLDECPATTKDRTDGTVNDAKGPVVIEQGSVVEASRRESKTADLVRVAHEINGSTDDVEAVTSISQSQRVAHKERAAANVQRASHGVSPQEGDAPCVADRAEEGDLGAAPDGSRKGHVVTGRIVGGRDVDRVGRVGVVGIYTVEVNVVTDRDVGSSHEFGARGIGLVIEITVESESVAQCPGTECIVVAQDHCSVDEARSSLEAVTCGDGYLGVVHL